MKRVLIFSLAYLPFVGGAELAIRERTMRVELDSHIRIVFAMMDS